MKVLKMVVAALIVISAAACTPSNDPEVINNEAKEMVKTDGGKIWVFNNDDLSDMVIIVGDKDKTPKYASHMKKGQDPVFGRIVDFKWTDDNGKLYTLENGGDLVSEGVTYNYNQFFTGFARVMIAGNNN